jgi:hypothetical protein
MEDGSRVYQMQKLKRYFESKSYFSSNYEEHCHNVSQCIKSRLSWTDLELMRDIVFMLSSHGWEKLIQEDDLAAIDRRFIRFTSPLMKVLISGGQRREEDSHRKRESSTNLVVVIIHQLPLLFMSLIVSQRTCFSTGMN